MTEKVETLKKRLHHKRLARDYPRVERGNLELSPDYLSEELSIYYPPDEDGNTYAAAKESPFDGYEMVFEVKFKDLPKHNNLLAYRMLKLLYGAPDILGTIVNLEKEIWYRGSGIDWGFTLQILPNLFAEFRSMNTNVRQVLRFWIDQIPESKKERARYGKIMKKFYDDLILAIDKNGHLFSEGDDVNLSKPGVSRVVSNVFAEKYRAAERLLDLARNEDHPKEKIDLRFDQTVDVATVGSIYISSAILFSISLEALINSLLTLLLRDEFRSEAYERATIRADLDVRLITAHVYCEGFERQVLKPKTELWGRVLKLGRFRNDVVHGNVTSEHYIYAIQEDGNTFYYSPVTDYRGRKAEAKASRNYPTTMAQIDEETVLEIKRTIDEIIDSILSAADEDTRKWLENWLWSVTLPPHKLVNW